MLSYRHSYHAGNFADVLKHLVQVEILAYQLQKDKSLCYIDTHAGAGLYAIDLPSMQKNAEYRQGISRLFGQRHGVEAIDRYLDIVAQVNPEGVLKQYPGSPWIARLMLRPIDKLRLFELHARDSLALEKAFRDDRRCKVYREDVTQELKSVLPPPERRGLLMVDPSYEVHTDYFAIPALLDMAAKRFTTGVFAVWYPVLQRAETEKLVRRVITKAPGEWLRAELCVRPDANKDGMTGSGMLVLRPPFGLQENLAKALPILQEVLQVKGGGSVLLETLR